MVLLPLHMMNLLETPAPPAAGEWMSVRGLDYVFTAPAAQSGYLNIVGGEQSSSTVGYLLEADYVCVGVWILRDSPVTGETFHITAGGSDTVTLTTSAGVAKTYNTTTRTDFSLGDIVGCRLDSGSTETITTVHVRFRRRIP
jgi:hypothetical protein